MLAAEAESEPLFFTEYMLYLPRLQGVSAPGPGENISFPSKLSLRVSVSEREGMLYRWHGVMSRFDLKGINMFF